MHFLKRVTFARYLYIYLFTCTGNCGKTSGLLHTEHDIATLLYNEMVLTKKEAPASYLMSVKFKVIAKWTSQVSSEERIRLLKIGTKKEDISRAAMVTFQT